jgi:hypothetical protein
MVINIGRSTEDRRLVNVLASTILTVFPTVHVMDLPDSFNSILFATVQPTSTDNLLSNYTVLAADPATPQILLQAMANTITNPAPDPQPAQIFTDDLAPIEWLTNSLVLDFIFSDDMEMLQ